MFNVRVDADVQKIQSSHGRRWKSYRGRIAPGCKAGEQQSHEEGGTGAESDPSVRGRDVPRFRLRNFSARPPPCFSHTPIERRDGSSTPEQEAQVRQTQSSAETKKQEAACPKQCDCRELVTRLLSATVWCKTHRVQELKANTVTKLQIAWSQHSLEPAEWRSRKTRP